jgi:hypothetical protein
VTAQADPGARTLEQTRIVGGVRLVTGLALSASERRVLHRSTPPVRHILVAGGAQGLARLDQESGVGTAMGLMTGETLASCDRRVDCLVGGLQPEVTMARLAKRAGTLLEKLGKASDMWVVASGAVAVGDRGVLDPGAEGFLQVVTLQAGLPLVDLVPGR